MDPIETVFTEIVRTRQWSDGETPCGPGSTVAGTKPIIEAFPGWFLKYQIRSIIDLGCGDFNWMSRVNLDGIRYDGFDVVKELVEKAQKKYARPTVNFHHTNILTSLILMSDLVILKDVLIHLPTEMGTEILSRIRKGSVKYLAATTYPGVPNDDRQMNPGQFFCLDMEAAPFGLGAHIESVDVSHPGWPTKLFAFWIL